MDWTKILFDWRQAKVPDSQNLIDWEEYYHDCSGKDHLVITAGDSWTYGDSLPDRLDQVYGRLISKNLNADWINIGCRGRSNSWMLQALLHLSTLVSAHYRKITVIITLTENGRDFETSYMFPYNYFRTFKMFGDTPKLYDVLLDAAKDYWIELINQIQTNLNTKVIVGQNFVWHDLNKLDAIELESNWIEKLAEHQRLPMPIRTNLVTGWIFDSIRVIRHMLPVSKSVFKQWALPYIDRANQVNSWLATSNLNNKAVSSAHPTVEGHKVWADYILTNINN